MMSRSRFGVALALLGLASFGLVGGVDAALGPGTTDFDNVCGITNVGHVNFTQEANDPIVVDFPLGLNWQVGSSPTFYGLAQPFSGALVDVGTAGVGGTTVWHYRGPTGWKPLNPVDGTNSFTIAGTNAITWAVPLDWVTFVPEAGNCGPAPLFYARALTSRAYTSFPVGDQAAAIL